MQCQMSFIKVLYHGRGPSWKDVGIDTAGVFLGILIILAIVSIYIALKKDNEEKSIEASDLRFLINELKLAGAEAIAINDKRIVNMSDMVDVNEYILINEDRVVSPYVIKAIGNQTYLSSALSLKTSGFIDSYRNLGKTVEMTQEKNIVINAYNSRKSQFQFRYAKEVEE